MNPIRWETKGKGPDDHNRFPLYGVTWDADTVSGRTGNSWSSREYAETIYRKKEREGKNPSAVIRYCGGFAF